MVGVLVCLLGFETPIFGIFLGLFFALRLKSIMVSFTVPNFHDLIERLENLSNFIFKCSNLFDFFHAHRHLSDSLTYYSLTYYYPDYSW